MTAQDILSELEALGTEKARGIYARHGAQEQVFGASFAAIGALVKQLKRTPGRNAAAEALWASGYMEARTIACQAADAAMVDSKLLQSWAASLSSHLDADNLAGLAAQVSDGPKLAAAWARKKDTNILRAGLSTYAQLLKGGVLIKSAELKKLLARIEKEIHTQSDFVKEAMNYYVIALGTYSEELREEALAAAARIGKVHIDHGETNCKTPDAAAYILKSVARLRPGLS